MELGPCNSPKDSVQTLMNMTSGHYAVFPFHPVVAWGGMAMYVLHGTGCM